MSKRRMLIMAWIAVAAVTARAELRAAQRYEAVPGVREFSGRLIVRPLPPQAWEERGLPHQAAAKHQEAVDRLEAYDVLAYVPQTDEFILRVPEGSNENQLSAELMATGLFEYAEPDWTVFPIGCPDDPRFGLQWHHQQDRLQSCDGWDLWTGTPEVSVGVCDTGIRKTHEDLLLHRLEGYNAVDRRWEGDGGRIDPVHPHGTMTTGTAAANSDNARGVAGVGWNLSHRMLRVSNDSSGSSSLSVLQHAARTAVESGDRVANVSYSGVDSTSNLTTATYIKSIGGLLVWAAGNDSRPLLLGNRDLDDIIVVGGTDRDDSLASFSAFGPFVDLVAPAVDVTTCDAGSDTDYASVAGTSFAAPLTSGLIALVWSADPSLTPDDVELILKQGTDDLGLAGTDDLFGYGRINVYKTISQVDIPPPPPPPDDCEAIARHRVRCREGGVIKGKVIFVDDRMNGSTIEITVDGTTTLSVAVEGDRAPYRHCCVASGAHTAAVTEPACPQFDRTVECP